MRISDWSSYVCSSDLRTILVAFAFIAVGIGMKAALFPLHIWLPNAYAYAPSVVSAFLAATATKVSIYVLIRVYLTLFGASSDEGRVGQACVSTCRSRW